MTAAGRLKAWLRYTRPPKAEVRVALEEEEEALPAVAAEGPVLAEAAPPEEAQVLETAAELSLAAVKVAWSAEPPQQEAEAEYRR